MDLKKLNIDHLDGPNWGKWSGQVQGSARILDCWDAIKGEREIFIDPTSGLRSYTYRLLKKPVTDDKHADYIKDDKMRLEAAHNWSKKNSQAMGLIQGLVSPALWPLLNECSTANEMWDTLEIKFGKAGGATTYLQLVALTKAQFTDSQDLIGQIQEDRKSVV